MSEQNEGLRHLIQEWTTENKDGIRMWKDIKFQSFPCQNLPSIGLDKLLKLLNKCEYERLKV